MPNFWWTFGSGGPRKLVILKGNVHYSLCFESILMWIRIKDTYLVDVQSIVRTRSRWPFRKAKQTRYFSLQSLKEPSRLEVIINGADIWKLQTDFFGSIWTPVKACLWPSRSPVFCPSWRFQMPALALSHPLTKILYSSERSTQGASSLCMAEIINIKVQVFWDGHKNLKLSLT